MHGQRDQARETNMTGSLIGGSLQAWRFAIAYFADRRQSIATLREFEALGLDECVPILKDYGLTRRDFANAMRLPFASQDLLSSAMQSIGIDPTAFHTRQAGFGRDMDRTCMLCDHRRRCRNDIATSDFGSRHRDFCPNSENFAEIIKSQRQPACRNDGGISAA